MTGFWEILLILIILAIFVGPWLLRKSTKRRKPGPRPEAREVDYEIDDES